MLVVTFSVVFGLNWNLYSYMIGNDCRVVFFIMKNRGTDILRLGLLRMKTLNMMMLVVVEEDRYYMLLLVQCLYFVLFNYVNVCIGSQSSAGLDKLWLELWYVPSHRFTGGFSACHEAPQDQRTALTRLRAGWTAVFPYLLLFSPEKNLGKVIHHFLMKVLHAFILAGSTTQIQCNTSNARDQR